MGLGLLASSLIRPRTAARTLLPRSIVIKPELQSPEPAIAPQPDPTTVLPPRTPLGGARVHFLNPEDAIEVFVDGYRVKIPKGMTVANL
ncbi:hypothetical protein OIU76_027885 [Salix suchowensis]|nr:hypothetical protein OIU76_027885 [Salix suchowensis]